MKLLFSILTTMIILTTTYAKENEIKIASGRVDGVYFKKAVEICNERYEKNGIKCMAIITKGSKENIELLKNKKADYAIIKGNLLTEKQKKDAEFLFYDYIHILYNGEKISNIEGFLNKKTSFYDGEGNVSILNEIIIKYNRIIINNNIDNLLCDGKIDFKIFTITDNSNIVKYHLNGCRLNLYSFRDNEAINYKKHIVKYNNNSYNLPTIGVYFTK